MSSHSNVWTIGVEEEYQIIDPHTRELSSASDQILSFVEPSQQNNIDTELQGSQIETATPICRTLTELRTAITGVRASLIGAATQANLWIAASGTHPFSHWNAQRVTAKERYYIMAQRYQQLVREQVILGCHVHIGCPDRERAIRIMNRARLWLTPLLALSANSPFWLSADTGYASFRTAIWSRWPMAGPPPHITSSNAYKELLHTFIQTQSIEDASHIYWDIRLSAHYPTIEFRVMDVCMTVDEAVMIAGLIRALVQTCAEQARQGNPYPKASNELLRVAHWRAARYGIEHDLTDTDANTIVSAHELIERFLIMLRPALEANGEWSEIADLVHTTLEQGNGSMRQRAIYRQRESYPDVIDFIVAETAKGVAHPLLA